MGRSTASLVPGTDYEGFPVLSTSFNYDCTLCCKPDRTYSARIPQPSTVSSQSSQLEVGTHHEQSLRALALRQHPGSDGHLHRHRHRPLDSRRANSIVDDGVLSLVSKSLQVSIQCPGMATPFDFSKLGVMTKSRCSKRAVLDRAQVPIVLPPQSVPRVFWYPSCASSSQVVLVSQHCETISFMISMPLPDKRRK